MMIYLSTMTTWTCLNKSKPEGSLWFGMDAHTAHKLWTVVNYNIPILYVSKWSSVKSHIISVVNQSSTTNLYKDKYLLKIIESMVSLQAVIFPLNYWLIGVLYDNILLGTILKFILIINFTVYFSYIYKFSSY